MSEQASSSPEQSSKDEVVPEVAIYILDALSERPTKSMLDSLLSSENPLPTQAILELLLDPERIDRFYHPIIVLILKNPPEYAVYITNDMLDTLANYLTTAQPYAWETLLDIVKQFSVTRDDYSTTAPASASQSYPLE